MLEAEVVWTGEGTWRPDNICYDWDKVTNKPFICSFQGNTLSYGQSATGFCTVAQGNTCD